MDNAVFRTAAPMDNAVPSRTAALMDNAVSRKILTTTVLFTVVIAVSVVHTVTAPTAVVAMEAMPIEFISFNLFVEVFKADKLLL